MPGSNAFPIRLASGLLVAAGGLFFASGALSVEVDVEAAKTLARQSNCFKCHSVTKEKDGPTWTSVALKYKDKPNAEQRLTTHLTTSEMAKFPDGHEEEHPRVKSKDKAAIKNLVDWILSL